jgi:hypothetical protein
MHRSFALALLVLAACRPTDAGTSVALLDYVATVPPTMESRASTGSMRLAEFDVPRTDGTQAEVIVYYFGQGQGGSADANIARWTTQFMDASGGHVVPHVMSVDGTVFPTTVAQFEGSYARGVGLGPGQGEAEPDQALVAAVVETPLGNLFLQLFGDRVAVEATRGDFLDMVTSIHRSSGAMT